MKRSLLAFLCCIMLVVTACSGEDDSESKPKYEKLETYSEAMSASQSESERAAEASSKSASSESSSDASVDGGSDGMPLPGQGMAPSESFGSQSSGSGSESSSSEIELTDSNVPLPSEYAMAVTDNTATTSWNAAQPTGYAKDFYDAVANLRAQNGLGPLNYYSELNSVAFTRLTEAANTFSHTRPDGRECRTVMDDFGLSYICYGENLARNVQDVYSAYQLWFNSPTHYANMLNANYTGFCIVTGLVSGVQYWVVIFVK